MLEVKLGNGRLFLGTDSKIFCRELAKSFGLVIELSLDKTKVVWNVYDEILNDHYASVEVLFINL